MEIEKDNGQISMLEGSEIVEFDEAKAKITLENPENDWSNKMTDGIGGEK
ncbi:hypothetical protein [Holdemania sp. 1001095H_141210_F2]|jgi:hypothetical protein|nr:hypothetical protein [Holdemania sp. 1001095H_141210_F2]